LSKSDGLTLIKDLEQHLEDNNPWQAHKSAWHPDEFKMRGFKVYCYDGARFLKGERGERALLSARRSPMVC
jgi:hypothetical protein